MKITKPKLDEISQILSLWEGQYNYHNNLDAEYYISNASELSDTFEAYLTKAINQDDPHILVAKVESEIVGFVTFEQAEADYFDTNIKDYGEVVELFVKEEYRKKGAGKALLEAAESHFKSKGLSHMEIQCSTFNKDALEFYKNTDYINRQTLLFKKI